MVIMETLSFPQSNMKDKFISWGHNFQPSTDNWTQVSDALWVEHIHQKMKCVPAWASLFSLPPLCRGSADEKGFWFLAFDCVFCRNTRSQRSRVISQCLFTRRLCFTLPSCLLYYDFFFIPKTPKKWHLWGASLQIESAIIRNKPTKKKNPPSLIKRESAAIKVWLIMYKCLFANLRPLLTKQGLNHHNSVWVRFGEVWESWKVKWQTVKWWKKSCWVFNQDICVEDQQRIVIFFLVPAGGFASLESIKYLLIWLKDLHIITGRWTFILPLFVVLKYKSCVPQGNKYR